MTPERATRITTCMMVLAVANAIWLWSAVKLWATTRTPPAPRVMVVEVCPERHVD